jgi:hypothetical protein
LAKVGEAKGGKLLRQPTGVAVEDVAKQKLRPNTEDLNTRAVRAISHGDQGLKVPSLKAQLSLQDDADG